MKNRLKHSSILFLIAATHFAQSALASPLYFATTDSYYDVVNSGQISWTDAMNAASSLSYNGRQGRLATVTSSTENDFIVSNFLSPGTFGFTAWIGGTRTHINPSDPTEGWTWIDGEAWSYTNWLPGEPSNSGGVENFLQLCTPVQNGQWNDHADGGFGTSSAYIVEYAAVPEPSSLALLGIGTAILIIRRRRD